MKRAVTIAFVFGSLVLLAWVFAQVPSSPPPDLAKLVPQGPLLYLEAKDFGALLSDWNASDVKRLWLRSDNFQVFSRSRLFLKLTQAQTEFASAAGVPPDMDLVANVAGGQSALAIYDIGQLEFLYITRLGSERFAAGGLWKTRGSYQPRQSSGIDYYIKTDPASKRVAAFAAAKDYVLLATREDVLAGALALIAGQAGSSVAGEQWFDKAAREAKAPGELRMVMNFQKLRKSPHFRSYWIQQNITELGQYSAAISDAARASAELREDRVLLRATEIAPVWNEAAVADVSRLAPVSAGLYRAWATPSSAQAFELLRRKILEPRPSTQIASKIAPVVALGGGAVGDETDLETRIDEPPLETGRGDADADIRKLLDGTGIQALLEVDTTRVQPDGVFIGTDSGVALLADADWDGAAIRNALTTSFAKRLTEDQIGVRWNSESEMDGLHQLAIATRGRMLVIATNRDLRDAMLAGLTNQPASSPARYAAVYRHSKELPNFVRMMRLIDNPLAKETNQDPPEPAFFSGNMASLGRVLAGIDSESIVVHDTGSIVKQSVVYKLK